MADRFSLEAVMRLLSQIQTQFSRQEHSVEKCLDPIGSAMIWKVLNLESSQGNVDGAIEISSYALAKLIGTTRWKVRSRISGLARFGLVRVQCSWRNDGSNQRKAMAIAPNPYLQTVLQSHTKAAVKFAAVKHFVTMGIERLQYEEDVQGFKVVCPYGREEPGASEERQESTAQLEAKLNKMVAEVDESKGAKLAEAAEWRSRDDSFVKSSADIWVYTQSRMGRGTARPNWEGSTKDLPPAAVRERRELTKTFRKYGGRITSLAWYVFVGGVAELDKNNRPAFYLETPHRQFASIDKKPSQFAKHFNAILKDPYFKDFATKDWESVGPALRKYYEDLMDVEPQDGETSIDKLGYDFGQTAPTLEDLPS